MNRQSTASDTTGWTIVTEQDPGAAITHLQFIFRSGSLSDPADKPGLAYFTARALLRGTLSRPYQELNHSIETLGAAIGVDVDPTQITYNASVLTENLDAFLDLMRDVLTQPAFSATDLGFLQKTVVGELSASLQDVRTLASRAVMKTIYKGMPLENPVEGTQSGISKITPQDASAFFRTHFVRENLIIGLTTPLTQIEAAAGIQSKLVSLPHGKLNAPTLPAPVFKGIQAVIVDRKDTETVPVFIVSPGVSDADPELLALETGNFIFGDDFTSRLMQVLRAQNGWTYGAFASYQQLLKPSAKAGVFSSYMFPAAEHIGLAVAKALSMFQDYASHGITADELKFATRAQVNRYPFQQDSAEKRLAQKTRKLLTGRDTLAPAEYSARIGRLGLAQVNSTIAAKTNFRDLLIAAVGDAAVLRPILEALPGVTSVRVVPINP
jgi:zinc protease